jgi:hypothetical protein
MRNDFPHIDKVFFKSKLFRGYQESNYILINRTIHEKYCIHARNVGAFNFIKQNYWHKWRGRNA